MACHNDDGRADIGTRVVGQHRHADLVAVVDRGGIILCHGRDRIGAGQKTVRDLGRGQRAVVDAKFVVGDVGLVVAAELRAPDPVVHVLDITQMKIQVQRVHQRAIEIPTHLRTVRAGCTRAVLHHERIVILHARRNRRAAVNGQLRRAVESRGDPLCVGGRAAIDCERQVVAGLCGARDNDRVGLDFTRHRARALARDVHPSEIEKPLPVFCGHHRRPDFNCQVCFAGNEPVRQVEISRNGGGRLIPRRRAGQSDGRGRCRRARAHHDGLRAGNAVRENRSCRRRARRAGERPAIDQRGVGAM